MLLRQRSNGHMVEVLGVVDLINPNKPDIIGRYQEGEEQSDPVKINKHDLTFLSGEDMPRCWVDTHYRDSELLR